MSIQEKREQMLLMIADWQQSGKSKSAYCVENGVNASKFYYWISRIKESDTSAVGFLAIDKGIKHGAIEIMYLSSSHFQDYSKIEKSVFLFDFR